MIAQKLLQRANSGWACCGVFSRRELVPELVFDVEGVVSEAVGVVVGVVPELVGAASGRRYTRTCLRRVHPLEGQHVPKLLSGRVSL